MKKYLLATLLLTACAPKEEPPPKVVPDFVACNEIQEQVLKMKPEEMPKEVQPKIDECKKLGLWVEAPVVEAEELGKKEVKSEKIEKKEEKKK